MKPGTTPAETAATADAIAKGASAAEHWTVTTKLGDGDMAAGGGGGDCTGASGWFTRLAKKAQSMTLEQWKGRTRALAPYAMLAMQPVFAALLMLTFVRSGRRYAAHFVFSLHTHSLWFLSLLLAVATGLAGFMVFAVFGHGLVAMRRVYGLGWWEAAWRGAVLSGLYFVGLPALAAGLVALIAATA